MKKNKIILGISIIWIPILMIMIAENITKILTMDFIINCVYAVIPAAIIGLIIMDIEEAKIYRRARK